MFNWIDAPAPGRLAIMPRPRGGNWLDGEVQEIKARGADTVVSLLGFFEAEMLDLANEEQACRKAGIDYVSWPIVDRSVPESYAKFASLIAALKASLNDNCSIVIHCRVGIGRSSVLAASLLCQFGVEPDDAFERISVARGCEVPDTSGQRQWVKDFVEWAKTHE